MNQPTLRRVIAGAIYDFAARLTCRDTPITLGAVHNAGPAAEACNEFLKLRDCAEGEPLVKDWQEHLEMPSMGFSQIQAAMKADPHYAWSWHCVVACAAMDEGLDHAAANRAAARYMNMVFDVDTSNPPNPQPEGETR